MIRKDYLEFSFKVFQFKYVADESNRRLYHLEGQTEVMGTWGESDMYCTGIIHNVSTSKQTKSN